MSSKPTIDLSSMTPDAINNAVVKMLAKSPFTVFPLLVAILLAAFWVIFSAVLWIVVAALGIAVIGVVNFAVGLTVKKQEWVAKYFKILRQENEEKAKKELEEIVSFLDKRNFEQGSLQVTRLENSMKSFERVLKRKFEPGEMTYAQYHRVAEQTYLAALQNLREIVTTIEAIDSIDPDYIQGRMGELERVCSTNDGLDDVQMQEVNTLKERWQLREDGLDKIDRLLTLNETAMTELEKIASTIANTNVAGNNEDELSSFIERLNNLGQQAKDNWK